MNDTGKEFEKFVEIVRQLRSENGCPWDREQSPQSLKRYLLEETSELIEAIDADDPQHIKEELGDLIYIITLVSQMFDEQRLFSIRDVMETISAKMIRRHPHVFNDEKIETVAELREKWLEIKRDEKKSLSETKKN